MRPPLAISACFVLLAAATLAPKLFLRGQPWRDDDGRLVGAMARTLRAGGLETRLIPSVQGSTVFASRGRCRLLARDGYDWPVLRAVFDADATPYGPIRYGYRAGWTTSPPWRARLLFDRFIQTTLARVRIVEPRAAVVALAQTRECGDAALPLARLTTTLTRSPVGATIAHHAIVP